MLIYKVLQDNGKAEKSKVQTVCIIPIFSVKRGKKIKNRLSGFFERQRRDMSLQEKLLGWCKSIAV